MKKVLIVLCALMLGLNASAQLNVKSSMKQEKFAVQRLGYTYGLHTDWGFWACTRCLGNLDDWVQLWLGADQESAVKTMQDLVDLYKTIGKKEQVTIDNKGTRVILWKDMGVLWLKSEDCINNAQLTAKELNTFLEKLKEWKNEN